MSVLLTVLFSSHLEMAGKAARPQAPHGDGHICCSSEPGTTPGAALLPAALPDPRAAPAPLQSPPGSQGCPQAIWLPAPLPLLCIYLTKLNPA